jgi:hypothetical protein
MFLLYIIGEKNQKEASVVISRSFNLLFAVIFPFLKEKEKGFTLLSGLGEQNRNNQTLETPAKSKAI